MCRKWNNIVDIWKIQNNWSKNMLTPNLIFSLTHFLIYIGITFTIISYALGVIRQKKDTNLMRKINKIAKETIYEKSK